MIATDEDILFAIERYKDEHGYLPSIRDICKMVGMSSPGSMKYRLKSLKERGLITYDEKKPRTIRVVR